MTKGRNHKIDGHVDQRQSKISNNNLGPGEAVGEKLTVDSPVSSLNSDQVIETTVVGQVIPDLLNRFGAGQISRRVRPVSLLSPALKASLAEYPDHEPVSASTASAMSEVDSDFYRALIAQEEEFASQILIDLFDMGIAYADIITGLVSDVMAQMNCNWQEDVISFVDITLAAATLRRALTALARYCLPLTTQYNPQKTACISVVPGGRHLIGAQVISDALRSAGWAIKYNDGDFHESLSVNIRKEWFTLIGISVSENTLTESCRKVIRAIRSRSLNPDAVIMVGGSAVFEDGFCAAVDADVAVLDVKHALAVAAKVERAWLEKQNGGGQIRTKSRWTSESPDSALLSLRSPTRLSTD